MAGPHRFIYVVIVSVIAACSDSAFGGQVSYYYAPATEYWVMPATPCQSRPRVIPVPDASPTARPPLPKIVTSSTVGGNDVPGSTPLAKDRCRVGFWNLSGRDVTLVVDGKTLRLAKNRTVSLDLSREFSWRIDNKRAHVERVGEDQMSHEVVIRE